MKLFNKSLSSSPERQKLILAARTTGTASSSCTTTGNTNNHDDAVTTTTNQREQRVTTSLSSSSSSTVQVPMPVPVPVHSIQVTETDTVFASNNNRRRSATCPTPSSVPVHEPKVSSHQSQMSHQSHRRRLNSREIPRTYSGLYGIGGNQDLVLNSYTGTAATSNLLPFELSRNVNTNWLHSYPDSNLHHNNTNHLRNNITSTSLLWLYISFIIFIEFALVVLPTSYIIQSQNIIELSFTFTNIIHGIITMIFLHWLKGSPNFYDHGELNALTLWEQLSCSPESNVVANQTKQVLILIPTLLCYLGCKFGGWDNYALCAINLLVWFVCVVAKMEGMHGVRLFGFNRTIGIDDDINTNSISHGRIINSRQMYSNNSNNNIINHYDHDQKRKNQ